MEGPIEEIKRNPIIQNSRFRMTKETRIHLVIHPECGSPNAIQSISDISAPLKWCQMCSTAAIAIAFAKLLEKAHQQSRGLRGK